MDDLKENGWKVDRANGLISHSDGFSAEMSTGQVRNIVQLPPGIPTRDIPKYISAAERAWSAAPLVGSERSDGEGKSRIAALIGHGPALSRDDRPVSAPRESASAKGEPTIKVKRRRQITRD